MKIKQIFYSLAVFVGTIIGVGIFSLPYVTVHAGLATMSVYFLIIGFFALLIHLVFGEIALRTPGIHRLPGYVDIYLGAKFKKIILSTTLFGFYGALLVYIIVGGSFLHDFLGPIIGGEEWIYQMIFFVSGFFLIWRGTGTVAKTELFFLVLFFIIFFILLVNGLDKFQLHNFTQFNLSEIFLPYGVLLFSLWGISVVPEARDLLTGGEKFLKYVLSGGIIISALTYFLFIIIVVGVSGEETTKSAILGLKDFLPNWVIVLGLLFGIITTFTSFLTIGLTLRKIFQYDYHFPATTSLLLTGVVPLILFVLGFKEFIKILGLVGAIALGIEGSLILLMHQKAKITGKRKNPEYEIKISPQFSYVLIGLLVIGVILEISR